MTRSKRRLIFYGLILVFVLITPATILYATGYSLDWEKKQIVKTGAFYFKSLPRGAKIFIDGEFKDTTPALVDRLLPRQYSIEISKDNFYSWKKNLEAQSHLVTEARNVFLVPKNPRINLVSENATSTQEYFLTEEQKRTLDQASSAMTLLLKDVLSWTVAEGNIYYLQKSNLILYKTDLSGSSKEQISFEPLFDLSGELSAESSYQIKVSPEQIAVFQPGGKFYLLNRELKIFEVMADEVQGAEFSSDNKKLLYWTSHEIWVLWLKEILVQPYKEAGEKELITRYSNAIASATWFAKTNEHIIFVVGKENGASEIKFIELDGRDIRNTYNVFSAKNAEIYFNEKDDLLYFLTQHKLYSLDLLNE